MEGIASVVGAVSGVISLLTVIYFAVSWKTKVDTDRRDWRECITHYPPAEMWTMVKTLWDIYVVEALHHRPDLAEHGSGFKLKKEGCELIPDYMKPLLDLVPRNPVLREDIATGYLVVKHIGLERITQMAEEKHITVQEAIALLSTFLEMNANNSRPTA